MRQAGVVDVEIRIEDGLALRPKEARLRLDPFARLHLFGIRDETRFQIGNDLRELIRDVLLLARVL